jgi:hypothetical protein
MGYRLHGWRSIASRGKRFFSFPQFQDWLWVPPSHLSNGNQELFPGIMRPRHEADRSPPSSAEVKNSGAIPPLTHASSWHGPFFSLHPLSFQSFHCHWIEYPFLSSKHLFEPPSGYVSLILFVLFLHNQK